VVRRGLLGWANGVAGFGVRAEEAAGTSGPLAGSRVVAAAEARRGPGAIPGVNVLASEQALG
jgi:hypothetical protein